MRTDRGEDTRDKRQRKEEEGTGSKDGETEAQEGRGERGRQAGKRQRTQTSYDETQRRVRRRLGDRVRHVARSRHAAAERGTLKRTVEVGPLTVERVVRGRYEWWDAGLRQRLDGARRKAWDGARTWDPGIW